MNIIQITPADKQSKSGNRTTAARWSRLLRVLGHRVTTATAYHDEPAHMMIALHAWHSREAIARFHTLHPDRPLVVVLTGTDINEYLQKHRDSTVQALAAADALVGFHDLVGPAVPAEYRTKLQVIYQSAKPLPENREYSKRFFDVCVIGHLRAVKDPLRAALAVRDLPPDSNIRVTQLGQGLDAGLKQAAEAETKNNPRYLWHGEVPGWRVRRELAKTRLMVISSRSEGGANVISEAIVAGVPILASRIDGNVGLLGQDYAGYFPVGDTAALRELMLQAESSPEFLKKLTQQGAARKDLFTPEREKNAWRALINQLINKSRLG